MSGNVICFLYADDVLVNFFFSPSSECDTMIAVIVNILSSHPLQQVIIHSMRKLSG